LTLGCSVHKAHEDLNKGLSFETFVYFRNSPCNVHKLSDNDLQVFVLQKHHALQQIFTTVDLIPVPSVYGGLTPKIKKNHEINFSEFA